MIIETERLELMPLTADQLLKLAEDLPSLERELAARYDAEPMEGHFLDIVKGQYSPTAGDPDDYFWHSFWLIIRKSDRIVVGSADFKDSPDRDGQTEIGYGLGVGYLRQGYMTESVRAMCRWAFGQPRVCRITAETETDNLPSQNVLKRCGFELQSTGNTLWWRLEKTAG